MISAASLYVEPAAMPALGRRFKNLPTIESVSMKAYTLSSFMEKIAGLVFVTAGILAAFATIITVGVVYNSARISLQERAWELASLRVLGFTRGEVAGILFGEFAIEIALGILIGLPLPSIIPSSSSWIQTTMQIAQPATPAPISSNTRATAAMPTTWRTCAANT